MGYSSVVVGDDGETIVYLKGEFDYANRRKLTQRLKTLEAAHRRRSVIIDLSAATFLDSTIIGALVGAHANGLNLTIRGAGGRVRRSLDVLGIPEILPFEE